MTETVIIAQKGYKKNSFQIIEYYFSDSPFGLWIGNMSGVRYADSTV